MIPLPNWFDRGWLMVALLGASCALGPKEKHVASKLQQSQKDSLSSRRFYQPEELGVRIISTNGQKIARWKETISPPRLVELPLLPPAREFSMQPRVSGTMAGFGQIEMTLDTGAPICVVHAGQALSPGIKLIDPKSMANTFKGLRSEELIHYGVIGQLQFGRLTLKNILSGVQTTESHPAGHGIDNVLGLSSLAKFSFITIDPKIGKVAFSLSQRFVPTTNLIKIPFTFSGMQLLTDVKINNQYAVTVLIDTGNDATLMLNHATIDALELNQAAATGKPGKFAGLGGVVETKTFQIAQLQLGPLKLENVEVVAVPGDFPPSIGSGLLGKYKTTYDFNRSCLWIAVN